jgi:hypothetical protein
MRDDIYGRYVLDVAREGEAWVMYRVDGGRRRAVRDFAIPSSLQPEEIAVYLDDMLHEGARPGAAVRRLD